MMRINTNPWKIMDAVLADLERSQNTVQRQTGTDVLETADAVLVKVNLPGFTVDQISLQLERNVLTLTATPADTQADDAKVLWRERPSGEQKRSIQIPVRIVHEGIEASLEHGVLTVRIPKAVEATAKRIEVKAIQS